MARVYIGNLGENASKREIEGEFEEYGPLKDVWVARNPPGFAFCVFEDRRDAEDAVRELDGKFICGSRIRVEMARGPSRGGRAARLGLTEKCYECGRIGHFARDCTRSKPGGRDGGREGGRRRSRSRSRSPRRYRSRSRSRSPRRRRSRSRSIERKYSSHSRSRSREREQRSQSPDVPTKQERSSPKDDRNNGDARRSPSKSRSQSPVSPRGGTEDS